jgi:hypothetical protein
VPPGQQARGALHPEDLLLLGAGDRRELRARCSSGEAARLSETSWAARPTWRISSIITAMPFCTSSSRVARTMPRMPMGSDLVGVLKHRRGLARDGEHLGLGHRAHGLEDADDRVAELTHVARAEARHHALCDLEHLGRELEVAAPLEVAEPLAGDAHHERAGSGVISANSSSVLRCRSTMSPTAETARRAWRSTAASSVVVGSGDFHLQLHLPAMSMR